MSFTSETKLLEFYKWFDYHKKTISDPQKRVEFVEKAMDNMARLFLHALEDIKVLEGRGRLGRNMEVITPANNLLVHQRRPTQVPVGIPDRKFDGNLDTKKIGNG